MKIGIGSDHGGFEYKNIVKDFLVKQGYEVHDFGSDDESSCDYNDYAIKVSESVRDKKVDLGILICGTGIGMSIMANKVDGVRAALVHDLFSAKATKEHNNSNVLCMGARVIGIGLALEIVETWLKIKFSNEDRHVRRVNKIDKY